MKTYSKRILNLASFISPCNYLADVGCDHGYLAEIALKNGLCEKVCITDISAKSLNKAIKLLSGFDKSKVLSVVCDGLTLVPSDCDQVVIAGMGGEEIVKILSASSFLPKKLLLSPMKNSEKVRRLAVGLGYRIISDTIFFDGQKYYFVITAELSEKTSDYTPVEFEYGRQSLKNPILIDYLQQKIDNMLKNGKENEQIKIKIQALKDIQNEVSGNL